MGKWFTFPSSKRLMTLLSWLKALVFWCWSLRKYFANPARFKISCCVNTLSIGKFNEFKFWFSFVNPVYEILSPYWLPCPIGCCGGYLGGCVDCGCCGGCWGGGGIRIPKLPNMLFIVEFNSFILLMDTLGLFPPPNMPPIMPIMFPKGLGGGWFWGWLLCWGLVYCWGGWFCYVDLAMRWTVRPDSETYSEMDLSSRSCLPAKTMRILEGGTPTLSLMRFLKSATFISLSIWN